MPCELIILGQCYSTKDILFYRIGGYARRKAVAKDWYSNGVLPEDFKMSGKVEIIQQSEYDISNVEVMFKELNKNSGYHVHLVRSSIDP